jgi:predicted CoA-binding protein|tara:strand:- start:2076 stop:2510 length:435 start_codon:yes stop_codon:yes gene_type:complete
MNINYPDSFIKKILEESNTIAIVGASSKEDRDSYKVMKYLLQKGYKVFPVNPYESGKNILGQKCYEDLESIKQSVDIVDVFRAHEAVLGIAKQAIKISAKVLWTQEDIIHHEAAELVEKAGLKVVMDRCPKKELSKPYWTSKTK